MLRPSSELDLFVAVARQRGFRRAAAELGISSSSLSDRLQALEARLGVRLFNRTTRSVSLTEAGTALLARVEGPLADLDAALDEVAGRADSPAGVLRLNAGSAVAQLVLADVLPPFLAAHPRVMVDLTVDDAFVDIVAGGFDAGLRYGERLAQDMIAVPIGPPQRYALVASPAFLAAHRIPRTPADLVDLPAILHRFPSGHAIPWEFERDGEVETVRPLARLACTDPQVELRAVIEGVGVLVTFEQWVRPAIADGRLVTLLEEWLPEFPGHFLYHPSRRRTPAALRAFIEFARARRRQEAG